ncbi:MULTISPECIES: sporulation protein YqfC [Clostridium]|uniref:Sporulation protein YqfC n=1 Tax=Clostridium cibarium TaxID=2762247 RepID=A0ABR8PNR7_9CLOT|nr:sporulation protein YqfC [Clostridium sp. HBUAS56017]MBD7909787.1 sporulation protein YqfC [Clostridium cibarium]
MESKKNRNKETIIDKLKIPRELIMDTPRIIVTSDREIVIENYKGIVAFEKKEMKINTSVGIIKVQGGNFEILYIGGDTITISGEFKAIIYEGYSI